MSETIDQKVVQMEFDNKKFESNVSTSMSTIDKLKRSLNFSGVEKGFQNIEVAAKKCDISILGQAAQSVQEKFSALEVMAVTTLVNITNSAVNAGKRIVSALTIDPIKSGFSEYETQINAVQTILANTESKGTTLNQVNAALDELNTYADKTIYNFTEMTRNIGTFTAAGVDLDTSVNAIKGIANLAAVSGSNAQQASTAMYQLSQALASGTVKLMDWNSVVNAGMGGQVFQDALKETARIHGIAIDKMIKSEGSFRETLQKGWLTSNILTETLNKFTGDMSESQLKELGYTDDQISEIIKLGETANDAATKVKTFSQLFDTLKEAAQSGWTNSWEIIVGDFGEAKELLTEMSDKIGAILQDSAKSRNTLLTKGLSTGWKQLLSEGIADEQGYIDSIKEVAKENGDAFDKMVSDTKKYKTFEDALKAGLQNGIVTSKTLTDAVTKMASKMRGMSGEELNAAGYTKDYVEQITDLETGIKNGNISMDDYAKKITEVSGRERLIQALRNAFDGLLSVIQPIKDAFKEVFPPITGKQLYDFTGKIEKFTEKLKLAGEPLENLKKTFKGLFSILDIVKNALSAIIRPVIGFLGSNRISSFGSSILEVTASLGDFFTKLDEGIKTGSGFSVISETITKALNKISDAISFVWKSAGNFKEFFSKLWEIASGIFSRVQNKLSEVAGWISDNVSFGDIIAGLIGGGTFALIKKFGDLVDKVKDAINNLLSKKEEAKVGLKTILSDIHDSLSSFQQGIKVTTIVGIAVAIGILTSSLKKISDIEPVKIGYSLLTIKLMIMELNSGFKELSKTLSQFNVKGAIKSGIAMMAIAEAVNILASAMIKMSGLSWNQIAKGLVAIGVSIFALSKSIQAIGQGGVTLRTSIAILALAEACKMLAVALQGFGSMSWEEIIKGLTGMGGALLEFTGILALMKKIAGGKDILFGSVALLIASKSLDKISENLKIFGEMSWNSILHGLTSMGGALIELGGVISLMGKIAGFSGVLGAVALLIGVQSLSKLASSLKSFGTMQWDEIDKGLVSMGCALVELAGTIAIMSQLSGFSGIAGSVSLLIGVVALEKLAKALKSFGQMQWNEIGRGLTAMGASLVELGGVIGLLGALAGVSGIIGAVAILIAVQGLGDLADALKKFGEMSWDEIGRGLTAMGCALTELGAVVGILGGLTGVFGFIGAGAILIGIQGLGDLADALKKFGEMSWDEIGRGLTAMGVALGELAIGSLLNTLSGLGASSISSIAEPLGKLADSVRKWTNVAIPDKLQDQLGSLANGIMKFTFGGLGAGAIAAVADPLGTMSDSVRRWSGVVVPENLGDQLGTLAQGVEKFTFSGIGAEALATAAPGVGQMADSVSKWKDVVVPEKIGEKLKELADGIFQFSLTFLGGWSLSAITKPFGDFADSVAKWKDVVVPSGIGEGLKELAGGIFQFSLTFLAGWSLGEITEPFGNLADAVKKWNGVTVPEDIQNGLQRLAAGINSLGSFIATGISIDAISSSLGGLADSLKKWMTLSLGGVGAEIEAFKSALMGLGQFDATGIVSGFQGTSDAIMVMLTSFDVSINNAIPSIVSSFTLLITSMTNVISSNLFNFTMYGQMIMTAISTGISLGITKIETLYNIILMQSLTIIRNKYADFYNVGGYLVQGFANGISANTNLAIDAAKQMASSAAQAARSALDEHSPSKVGYKIGSYFGIAFVNAVAGYASNSYEAGLLLSESAKNGLNSSVSKIADLIQNGIDARPTIRPVIDLTDVKNGEKALSSIFGRSPVLSLATSTERAGKAYHSEEGTSGNSSETNLHGPSFPVYQFTQNNYSPKALSRLEIYRQTKNQFSMMKGLVKA